MLVLLAMVLPGCGDASDGSESGSDGATDGATSGVVVVASSGIGEAFELDVEGGRYASSFLVPRAGASTAPLLLLPTYVEASGGASRDRPTHH